MERVTLIAEPSKDYELLDSGREEKLERYGQFILVRPDPQALWEKALGEEEWSKAQGKYVRTGKEGGSRPGRGLVKGGGWETKADLPKEWPMVYGGATFNVKPTAFKHTGVFPEQLPNWEWVKEKIQEALGRSQTGEAGRPVSVLNLFAYTGGATLASAKAGAQVTHVDASKTAVAWARENAALSGLSEASIRWIIEDVLVFLRREIKRGVRYDAVVMDPPAFGHGPKDELWKIEENLLDLLKLCAEVLSDNPLFVLMSGYAAGYSPLAFGYNLDLFTKKYGGHVECGDLTIRENGVGNGEGRLLPCGIFARWSK